MKSVFNKNRTIRITVAVDRIFSGPLLLTKKPPEPPNADPSPALRFCKRIASDSKIDRMICSIMRKLCIFLYGYSSKFNPQLITPSTIADFK